jgi:protein MBA1
MMWKLHKFKSVRIVSHRASPIGEDHPDTAYRQAVIRLESVQSLTRRMGNKANTKGLQKAAWLPDAVREQQEKSRMAVQKQRDENGMETVETHNTQGQFAKTGVKKTVVEYIVLQQRVVQGKPEEWKVWGFTEESTPESVQEDEEYWRRTVDMQASS